MKILIVGDSYAATGHKPFGWTGMIENLIPGSVVDCHGFPGTSLYYTYRMLKKHDPYQYDAVIFVVTDHHRLYVDDDHHMVVNFEKDTVHCSGLNPDIIDAGAAYYQHLYNSEYAKFLHMLTYHEINRMLADHPKVVTIAAFRTNEMIEIPGPLTLVDIHLREFEGQDITRDMALNVDHIFFANHMSPTNNKLLARYVVDMLMSGSSKITMDDFRPGYSNMADLIKIAAKEKPKNGWSKKWLS